MWFAETSLYLADRETSQPRFVTVTLFLPAGVEGFMVLVLHHLPMLCAREGKNRALWVANHLAFRALPIPFCLL